MILDRSKTYIVLLPAAPTSDVYGDRLLTGLYAEGITILQMFFVPGTNQAQFIEVVGEEVSDG